MASTMKKAAVGLLAWLLFVKSDAKSTPAKKEPAPPEKGKKKKEKGADERPKAGPLVPDLGPDSQPASPKGEKGADDDAKQPPKKKKNPDGSGAKGASPTNKQAAELAENFFGEYTGRGIDPQIAAAECLTIYLLAGGNDAAVIRRWQKAMGVTPSGDYDKETSTHIATVLDLAIDGAINTLIQKMITGEQPGVVAAEVLNQYLQETKDIGALRPREKIAALQLLMGSISMTGRYDELTKARQVELGVTPIDAEE